MSIQEICIYILPVVYLLIILAHLFKFKKEKLRYNYWLFALMFIFPILLCWGFVNEAFNGMITNSTFDRLMIFGGIATIVPALYVLFWIMLKPQADNKEEKGAPNDKDKASSDDRIIVAAPVAIFFILVSGEVLMDTNSKINASLTELAGSQGWIYYVSTVDKVTNTGPRKYTVYYQSDYGFRDTDSFGLSKDSPRPHDCPYKIGDKALWRRGYGMKGASFKVMNYNDANKPELAKIVERYNTPILEIDHKEFPYNSVTKPSEYGINILYKAVAGKADSGKLCLRFKDIHNVEKSVMYHAPNQRFLPDTFLLFNNEVSAPNFVVCTQQINTRENWAKVSDYGYIFGFEIYSKAEIEDRFEEVRKYMGNLRMPQN